MRLGETHRVGKRASALMLRTLLLLLAVVTLSEYRLSRSDVAFGMARTQSPDAGTDAGRHAAIEESERTPKRKAMLPESEDFGDAIETSGLAVLHGGVLPIGGLLAAELLPPRVPGHSARGPPTA